MFEDVGATELALSYADQAIDVLHGPESPVLYSYVNNRASLLASLGRREDALYAYEYALRIAVRVHGTESAMSAGARRNVEAARAALASRG